MPNKPKDPDKTIQEDWTSRASVAKKSQPRPGDPDKTVQEDWMRRAASTAEKGGPGANDPDKTIQEDWTPRPTVAKSQPRPGEPDKTVQEDWITRAREAKKAQPTVNGPDKTAQMRSTTSAPEPKKTAVAEIELLAWLNAMFKTYPQCSLVTVEKVIRLEVADSEGCNWSRTLILNPRGVSPEVYVCAYAVIVEKGRRAFVLRNRS